MDVEELDIPSNLHEVRITSGGKIRAWVKFVLDSFQAHPNKPLILHTLPAAKSNPDTENDAEKPSEKRGLSSVTTSVSRLVSVVEIIKREYLNTLQPGQPLGLYQYNEIGYLEEKDDPKADDSNALMLALQGKNFPKLKKTPYMKITLCQVALPQSATGRASYQPPMRRKFTIAAKARFRKRRKRMAMLT